MGYAKNQKPKKINTVLLVVVLIMVVLFGVRQFFARAPIAGTNPVTENATSTPSTQVITYAPGIPASST